MRFELGPEILTVLLAFYFSVILNTLAAGAAAKQSYAWATLDLLASQPALLMLVIFKDLTVPMGYQNSLQRSKEALDPKVLCILHKHCSHRSNLPPQYLQYFVFGTLLL